MARGKIQIKRIENQTNRQVTYSKRRNGLFKKAHELTVLCDARVSIIMFSSSNKLHEFISPNTTTKEIIDLYQTVSDVDVWSAHYERMQETKRKLLETNRNLRTQIKQRLGECLDELDTQELRSLEEEMENTFKLVRERKELRAEDPHYGLVDNGGDYDSVIGYQLRFQPNHHHHYPNHALHAASASDIITFHLLE
ncbi:hypothetical protein Bca4012_040240 [Brassica carinata]